jgi:hypothetical protein
MCPSGGTFSPTASSCELRTLWDTAPALGGRPLPLCGWLPCDPAGVRRTASPLGARTLPLCDPKSFDHFVDILTGEEMALLEFCGHSQSLRECESMLRQAGTIETARPTAVSAHVRNGSSGAAATGPDHVHVVSLDTPSPSRLYTHDGPPVLTSPSELTPLPSYTLPTVRRLMIVRNVIPTAVDGISSVSARPTPTARHIDLGFSAWADLLSARQDMTHSYSPSLVLL